MKRLLVLLAGAALLGGCTAVPGLPSGRSYQVVVEFADVLDLVPLSAVKVDDVTVGSVEEIWLSGWTSCPGWPRWKKSPPRKKKPWSIVP